MITQMAQTEEFMFQSVAYRPNVYRTGAQAVAGSSLSNQTTFPVIVLAFIGITLVLFA